jgi:RHS repeat-associated protein
VTATRYYSHAGQLVAMRTAAGVTWLMADQQGTTLIALNASDQTALQRRQTPFGSPRGSVPSWPNQKGFVGGTVDPTGLVQLGIREYDPGIGRFVSADPVIDHGDPQQVNGYAYADNSPVTMSDPSGRRFCENDTGPCTGPMPSHDPVAQPAPGPTSPEPPASPAPKKSHNNGSGPFWAQPWNKVKSGFHAAVNWAEQHKAEIAGAAVGLAVGIGCGVAIGWTGVGAIACGALAGAVGSMVTYALATPAKERSLGGLLVAGAIGAVTGAVGAGIGMAAAPVVGAAARTAGSAIAKTVVGTAARRAVGAGATAIGSVARPVASLREGGLIAPEAEQFVYRGLAQGEDASAGLAARNPGATNDIVSHIAGQRDSQWISTTKSLEIAQQKFGQFGVVRINLGRVGSDVVDVSGGIPGMPGNYMLSRWAQADQEVLIRGNVPPEAIELLGGGG